MLELPKSTGVPFPSPSSTDCPQWANPGHLTQLLTRLWDAANYPNATHSRADLMRFARRVPSPSWKLYTEMSLSTVSGRDK